MSIHSRVPPRRSGFTLLELLIVLVVCLVLLVMMLPMFQRMREQARLTQCKNNLKAIGLAMHNYHDKFNYFPMGCTGSTGNDEEGTADDWGYSWWVPILPDLGEAKLFNQWNFSVSSSGFDGQRPLLRGVKLPMARCPSTTLTKYAVTSQGLAVSSYVGIAGAYQDQYPYPESGQYERSYREKFTSESFNGRASFGGMLHHRGHLGFKDVLDGSSNTFLFGEQSDFCIDVTISKQTIAISSWPQGMWCGSTGGDRFFNVTTVRHPPNYKQSEGGDLSTRCQTTGVCGDMGNNNPLQSAHEGGAHVLVVDGTVRFVSANIDFSLLLKSADRADGIIISRGF